MFVAIAWASSRSRITIQGLELVMIEGLGEDRIS
jgi:hypothetical protein